VQNKTRIAQDWHPEQVKSAIRMRGVALTQLAENHGYEASAIRKALTRPWPAVEAIIARFLDIPVQTIWPSRYDLAGNPKRQRSNGKRVASGRLRQKSQAA